ncbi:MAG: glycosyltransferase family 39 protein, partial [Thermodesulfobacteriota bacterium]
MQILLFIIPFLLIGISIVLISVAISFQLKFFRIASSDRLLAAFLLAGANIIFATLLLSELHSISVSGYLFSQLGVLVLSVVFARRFCKDSTGGLTVEKARTRVARLGDIPHCEIEEIIFVALFLVVALVTLVSLFLALYVPPGSYDAMTHYLSRVGYWHQYGSLRQYYTNELRQVLGAPNAGILILWLVTFLKSDLLAGTLQWIAYVVTGLAIYRTAINLGSTRRASIFAALIFMSLPKLVMHSSSTHIDIVYTAFTLIAFYFFHRGVKLKRYGYIVLSSIGFAVALGTSGAVFYALPALIIATLALTRTFNMSRVYYIRFVAITVFFFLLLSSYNYIQNYSGFGSFFGPRTFIG